MTTFDKAVLRGVAAQYVTDHDAEVKRYAEAKAQCVAELRRKHTERYLPRVKAIRDLLTEHISKGTLPTRAEVRTATGNQNSDISLLFWYAPYSSDITDVIGYPPNEREAELAGEAAALIAFLDTLTDETVSANALKTVGFTRLAPLFKAAAAYAADAKEAAQ